MNNQRDNEKKTFNGITKDSNFNKTFSKLNSNGEIKSEYKRKNKENERNLSPMQNSRLMRNELLNKSYSPITHKTNSHVENFNNNSFIEGKKLFKEEGENLTYFENFNVNTIITILNFIHLFI